MIKELKGIPAYDYYIVAFSGGKDSLACVLHLLDSGIPKENIELWHHCIDGREGSTLMDWPVTEDYCRKVAEALGITIYFSWKVGGFEREMTRKDSLTAPTKFEYPDTADNLIECGIEVADGLGVAKTGGTMGKKNTRLKFPQISGDLRVRWCSAYLKIDVCVAAVNNQPRFVGSRTLIVTGERAAESSGRAKYKTFEPYRADRRNGKRIKRHVDHLRPVHKWSERQVWDIIQKSKIEPHPAYILGWGRLSCLSCIFGLKDQWASIKAIALSKFKKIAAYEKEFNLTIHRTLTVEEHAAKGKAYETITEEVISMALSETYTGVILNSNWRLPAGAYSESGGPS